MTKSYWEVVQAVKDLETAKTVCQRLNDSVVRSHLLHNSEREILAFTKGQPFLVWMLTATDSEMLDLKGFVKGLAEVVPLWQLAQWKKIPNCQEPEWEEYQYILVRKSYFTERWDVVPCGENLVESDFGFITSPKTVIGKNHFKLLDRS